MKWAKSIFALLVAGIMALYDYYNTGAHTINALEVVAIALAVFNAATVWLVPNTTRWPWFKGGVSFGVTALNILVTVLTASASHNFSMTTAYQAILMLAQTFGVASIPNTGEPLPATPLPIQVINTDGQVAMADGTLGGSQYGTANG